MSRSNAGFVFLSVIMLWMTMSSANLCAETGHQVCKSPGGIFELQLKLEDEGGRPLYQVRRNGKTIVDWSGLGMILADEDSDWTKDFVAMEAVESRLHDTEWTPVWGESNRIRDHYRSGSVEFRRNDQSSLGVEFRVYDEGAAFRYVIKELDDRSEIEVEREETEFRFEKDHPLWAVYSAQGKYSKVPISKIKHSVERPCVLEPEDGSVIAIAEAAMVDYARMRLRRDDQLPSTLISRLHGPVVAKLPLVSPWRVVMADDNVVNLYNSNSLILNLNQPCQIKDTRWIKPGKVIREVTLSTDGGMACVDFAVNHGLQFIEFDAGWYGNQQDEASDARTVSRSNLDLPAVMRYAREHDIDVILYVNRRHLERDLDELLPLYRSWGIAGLKFGFVQHGDQKWTRWMHEAIEKAAEYEMMVDVHDEYRMTGWQRTYPNFMTAEGIGGDETRPPNEQSLTNLFTRMLAGPADHTFCYYNGYVDQTTSHASQLAKTICFFSPWQFLFWYDQPSNANDEPELEFFKHLPTTWDESHALQGRIGQYAVFARRSGEDWYVGCFNATEPRDLQVHFDFLPPGKKYRATIYRDDATVQTRTRVGIEQRQVDASTVFTAEMSERGGVALRLVPIP